LLDDRQALHQAPHPFLGRHPERLVLLVAIAQPHAEDEAPFGDDVERGHLLGHVDRIEQRQQDHRGKRSTMDTPGGCCFETIRPKFMGSSGTSFRGRDLGELHGARPAALDEVLSARCADVTRPVRARIRPPAISAGAT
jgi:hypothetical protein